MGAVPGTWGACTGGNRCDYGAPTPIDSSILRQQLFSMSTCQNLLEGLLEHGFLGCSPRDSDSVWSEAQEFAFLTSPQEVVRLLAQGSDCESHSCASCLVLSVASAFLLSTPTFCEQLPCARISARLLSCSRGSRGPGAQSCLELSCRRVEAAQTEHLNPNLSHSRTTKLNCQPASGLHSTGIYGAFDKTCLHIAPWSS